MGATVDIDTGGTFTDGYFTRDGAAERVKVDTTPHDFTECLAECVRVGAERLGYPDVQSLLLDTDVFRFSSTIGTNSLIQRSGPRLGLLVSQGAAENLYADGSSTLYEFLVRRDLVVEIEDATNDEEVLDQVRALLVAGARILVVSLENSEEDPSDEQRVKQVVQREYPRHYLGSVPCLAASDVTPRPGPARRTATAVVNAYLHPDMVRTLYKSDEDLRAGGYRNPLLIVHASGGVARVSKTTAIETYNSGPVGGVYGSARAAAQYDLSHVVTMDIGGTSTDVSVIADSEVPFDADPTVDGISVHVPMVSVEAIGGGGGSIARRTESGDYRVGPDSAGAVPGPASYGLGGTNPTATDAELVLGHLDPEWFLGGRRKLDQDRARKAIGGISKDDSVEEASSSIHRALARTAATKVRHMIETTGVDAHQFALFAFGGGGGLYGAEVAAQCGINRVFSFQHSPVFSAFGISGMDISHVYELRPGSGATNRIDQLRQRARLDAQGEHLDPDTLEFTLEAEVNGSLIRVDPDEWTDDNDANVLRLRATAQIPHASIPTHEDSGKDASSALKGQRNIYIDGSFAEVDVYDRQNLRAGNVVDGPVIVESADTTILVPEGFTMSIDSYLTAVMEVK